jgi:hypothetical protein
MVEESLPIPAILVLLRWLDVVAPPFPSGP